MMPKPQEQASPTKRRRRRSQPPPSHYLVSLHPWAAKLNARRLSGIKLAQILSGETCSPISLPDFELYLVYREVSIEQLQFVVWFNDYRQRVASGITGTVRNPSISSMSSSGTSLYSKRQPLPSSPTEPVPIARLPALLPSYNDPVLRQECTHVISTFLVPGSPKELLLDADRREKLIKGLETSCHPDLFQPVYDEVYSSLENETLPRFLAYSLPNINLPKQILWYITGIAIFAVNLVIIVLMILYIPPPIHNRAWRLLTVPFFHMGITAPYAAFQGFCAQVFHRGAVQLHAWELRQMDEEAQTYVDFVRSSMKSGGISMGVVCNAADGSYSGGFKSLAFGPTIQSPGGYPAMVNRPPLFGPERVVQDPQVRKAHRQLMNGVWFVGFTCDLLYSAIIFSIPGRST